MLWRRRNVCDRVHRRIPGGMAIARTQNTEANANTQRAKPAWSCRYNDLFGHREIPDLSPWCNAFVPGRAPGTESTGPAALAGGLVLFQERMILRQLF